MANKLYLFEYMNECERVDLPRLKKWLNKVECDYIIVKHDKDDRVAHYHAFVRLKNARSIDDIAKQVNDKAQYINYIDKWKNALAYAFHLTPQSKKDGKALYSKDAVVGVRNVDIDGIFETAKNYEDNKTRLRDLLVKYGECEISKEQLLKSVSADDYLIIAKDFKKMQEYRLMKVRDRDMTVIYLTGASGSGKTTLAKYFARVMNYDTFVSGSGKDILDGYDKQECIILDDLRGDVFTKAELFKLTDNNTNSSVKSRYNNKDISYCKLMIITSIKDPRSLYNWDITSEEDKDESFIQFARRLQNRFYCIRNNDIIECVYDLDYVKTTKNLMPFNMAQVFEMLGIEKKLGSELMDAIIKKTTDDLKKKEKELDNDLPF